MRAFIVLLQKEFIQIGRNVFLSRLIVAFPVLVMLIMPLTMTMDVRNVNVAVADADRSPVSNRMISHMEASERITLAGQCGSFAEAMKLLEDGAADIIVDIPSGFERGLAKGERHKISITANAVNAIKGSMGVQYLMQSISSALEEIREGDGTASVSDLVSVQNRFNPTLNYRHYMIPALMIMLFILICGFLPSLSIVGEKESGTIEQINVTPVSRRAFTLSKLIPYWFIGLFVLSIAMLVARLVYGLAPAGSIGAVYLGALLFILTISGFSLTVANFSDTMQQTVFVMFFFIMIFILMSGLLTPVDSMPQWAQTFTLVLPPRYFVDILRSVYLKGASVCELWTSYAALGGFALLFNILAALTYKKQA